MTTNSTARLNAARRLIGGVQERQERPLRLHLVVANAGQCIGIKWRDGRLSDMVNYTRQMRCGARTEIVRRQAER